MSEEDRFRKGVQDSQKAVLVVGAAIQRKGYGFFAPPMQMRATMAERDGYGDDCDAFWCRPIEIKHRTIPFTCAADFPHDTIFVDRVEKVDRLAGRLFYVMVSLDMTHAAVITYRSREHWVVTQTHDGSKGYGAMTVYACPKEHARFCLMKDIVP